MLEVRSHDCRYASSGNNHLPRSSYRALGSVQEGMTQQVLHDSPRQTSVARRSHHGAIATLGHKHRRDTLSASDTERSASFSHITDDVAAADIREEYIFDME